MQSVHALPELQARLIGMSVSASRWSTGKGLGCVPDGVGAATDSAHYLRSADQCFAQIGLPVGLELQLQKEIASTARRVTHAQTRNSHRHSIHGDGRCDRPP